MKTLITGATGFIGQRLARILVDRGENVVALCRRTADVSGLRKYDIPVRWGDVGSVVIPNNVFRGVNRIYHLAAYARNWAKKPETFFTVNVIGLQNVLRSAIEAGVSRVVVASSEVIFGPSNGFPVTEHTNKNVKVYNDYQRSKIMAETVVEEFVSKGLEVVSVNPTRLFGPGLMSEGNSVTKMIKLYLEGKWRLILGDGTAVGNYAFIEDVVNGFILAMTKGRNDQKYILGGENLSYNEFFDTIEKISGLNFRRFHIPPLFALAYSHMEEYRARIFGGFPLITPGWVRMFIDNWECSSEKAMKELGYTITPAGIALENTIDWLGRTIKREKQ